MDEPIIVGWSTHEFDYNSNSRRKWGRAKAAEQTSHVSETLSYTREQPLPVDDTYITINYMIIFHRSSHPRSCQLVREFRSCSSCFTRYVQTFILFYCYIYIYIYALDFRSCCAIVLFNFTHQRPTRRPALFFFSAAYLVDLRLYFVRTDDKRARLTIGPYLFNYFFKYLHIII